LRRTTFYFLKHSRFRHAQAQHEQHQAQSAADEICRAPIHFLRNESANHRAEHAHGGDDGRAVAAQRLGQHFGDERDAATEFACQTKAGDKSPHGIGFDGMDKAIGNVGNGVKQDGAEEKCHAPDAVAKNAEENAADQHTEHLQVQQQDAVIHQQLAGKSHVCEARNAQDSEQN
jgi:hypothetical protein